MSPELDNANIPNLDDFVADFLQFGGQSYYLVPSLKGLEPSSFSLSVWLKSTGTNDDNQYVIAYGRPGQLAFSISGVSTNLTFTLNQTAYPTGKSLADGKWHFLVVTVADNTAEKPVVDKTIQVFLDGKLLLGKSAGAAAATVATGLPLAVGCAVPQDPDVEGYHHFQGAVHNLAIWSKALRQDASLGIDEVSEVMKNGILLNGQGRASDPHITLYWALDTSQLRLDKNVLLDSSNAHNDGTIQRETRSPYTAGGTSYFNKFPTGELTVETWLCAGPESAGSTLLNYSESQEESQYPRLWITGLHNPTVWLGGNSQTYNGITLNDGRWHHVAWVFKPAGGDLAVQLIVDFVSRQTQTFDLGTWQSMNGGQSCCLGVRFQTDAEDTLYHGLLRSFRLWSRALPVAELKQNAFVTLKPGADATLRACYPLDRAGVSATQLLDASGNGNHLHTNYASWLDIDWVDLSGQDLSNASGFTFRHAFLRRANLSQANLSGQDFSHADLNRARLTNISQAHFSGARLDGAQLCGTVLDGSDLTSAQIQVLPTFARNSWYRTSFRNARLPAALIGSDWSYLDLTKAQLPDLPATLAGLKADYAVLSAAAMLSGRTVTGASFRFADLSFATLSSNLGGATAAYTTLANSCFDGADLSSVNANQVNFESATFRQALLRGAICTACSFKAADLTGAFLDSTNTAAAAKLAYSYMPYAVLRNARLGRADFTSVHLYGTGATVAGADLSGTDFTQAVLSEMSFSQATLDGTVFNNAQLINCSFGGTTLKDVKFEGAMLQGADFGTATVKSCNFTGAAFGTDGTKAGSFVIEEPDGTTYTVQWPDLNISALQLGDDCVCPDGISGPCKLPAQFVPAAGRGPYPPVPVCVPDATHTCAPPDGPW